jgi:hypothetical protein
MYKRGRQTCSGLFCLVRTEQEVKLPPVSEEWLEISGIESVATGKVRRNIEMLFIVGERSSHGPYRSRYEDALM